MASKLVHTRVKRIHEELDQLICSKKNIMQDSEGVPINYHYASKKLADDFKRYQQEIQLAKKQFPLYKRLKDL